MNPIMILDESIGLVNLLTMVALFLFTVWFIRENYSTLWINFPPGPAVIPYPLNALTVFFPKDNRFGRLINVSRRYGDLASYRLDDKRLVVVASPAMVRDLIVKQPDVTSNREPPPFFQHVMDYTGGIMFSHGEPWQELRRFSLSALRNFGMGRKGIEERIQEESRTLCETISQLSGEAFDAVHLLNAAVSNIICGITFGRRFDYDDPKFMDLMRRLRILTTGANVHPFLKEILTRFPILLKTPLVRTPSNNILRLKDFIASEVEEHSKTYDPTDNRDIIDMYLGEVRRLEASGKTPYLAEDAIWMSVFDLFLAGTETTSSTLLWLLLILAGKPDIQQKVLDEIDRVIGRERAPCAVDRKDMPYTDATLTEVLRYRPVAPVGVPHVAAADITIAGYTIPKDTEILISILAIHHDPKLWKEPEVFNPNRFLSTDEKSVLKDEAFIVFGAGRRICIGEQLARMEFFLFATALLQRFRFLLPEGPGTADFGFEHCFGVLTPKSFQVIAQER